MNRKNDYIREYLGVDKWHEAGYTGSRVEALTGERLEGPYADEHGKQTRLAFLEIAPDAALTYAPVPGASNLVPQFLELKGDACVMFASVSSGMGDGGSRYADPVIPEDLFVCVSAGNDGDSRYNGWINADSIYGVGAVNVMWSAMRNGEPKPGAHLEIHAASYTSHSPNVDFGGVTELWLDGYMGRFNGTSCSAPTLAGMAALVNDFFIDKTGKPLTHKAMYQFMKDCSVDIEDPGKDEKVGWGIPRLPDPTSVDIGKYQPNKEVGNVEILLIAGHGDGDSGAVSGQYKESEETRKLVPLIAKELSKYKVGVSVYNTNRNARKDQKDGSLKISGYDYVLEVHFNASAASKSDGQTTGVECYVTTSESGVSVEEAICKNIAALGFRNRGVKRENFAVISAAKAAGASSALLEVCFIDDPDDMSLYTKNRQSVAEAVAEAIAKGFGLEVNKVISVGSGDNPADWAKTACEWAKAEGLFQGDGKGNYDWQEPVTRQQLAAILYRQSQNK